MNGRDLLTEGNEYRISCQAGALTSPPRIKWFLDDDLITDQMRNQANKSYLILIRIFKIFVQKYTKIQYLRLRFGHIFIT